MHTTIRGAATAALAAAALALGAGTAAAAVPGGAHRHDLFASSQQALFVQTDNLSGNQIAVYARAANGSLTLAHTYPTGGNGGQLVGSQVDFLASQASLAYDSADHLLYAVNAGSNTISVFSVFGTQLSLRDVVPSGGSFPVSIALQGNLVYVLNALGGGTLAGFRQIFGGLLPIPGSSRPLGLDPNETPQFTSTPGQVAFSPDGSQLIVTTKNNGDDIDVFAVGPFGLLSPSPVVNPEPGTVPFALGFTPAGWARGRRGGHQCGRPVRARPRRHAPSAGFDADRRARDLLDHHRREHPLRIRCRWARGQHARLEPVGPAVARGHDRNRPGRRRLDAIARRALSVCPDRRQGHRRRVRGRSRRNAHTDRLGDGRGRRRRGGDRRLLKASAVTRRDGRRAVATVAARPAGRRTAPHRAQDLRPP